LAKIGEGAEKDRAEPSGISPSRRWKERFGLDCEDGGEKGEGRRHGGRETKWRVPKLGWFKKNIGPFLLKFPSMGFSWLGSRPGGKPLRCLEA
jgi:hypothetical protein